MSTFPLAHVRTGSTTTASHGSLRLLVHALRLHVDPAQPGPVPGVAVVPANSVLRFAHALLLLEKLHHELVSREPGVHARLCALHREREPGYGDDESVSVSDS